MSLSRTAHPLRLALAATLVAVLAACGGSNEAATGAAATPTSTGAAPAVTTVQAGKLTTCTHLPYPPFQFEQNGKITGFDVELVDLIAKRLGLTQEIVDTPFETIKTGADLNAGKCDLAAAGMTINDERKANLDFSVPYFDATQALLAKKGSGITSIESAEGKKMGSQSATTGEEYVTKAGFDPVSFETSDAELNGLKSGQVEVIVQDLPVVSEWLKDPANAGFEIVANLDTGEQYGLGLKKGGNPALLEVVDEVITQAKSDGSYDALYEKWIGQKPTS